MVKIKEMVDPMRENPKLVESDIVESIIRNSRWMKDVFFIFYFLILIFFKLNMN